MKGEKSTADTDLTDSLDGRDASSGPGTNDELGPQRLEFPTSTDRTRAGGQLLRERLVDTRELVLTAHGKRLISALLGVSSQIALQPLVGDRLVVRTDAGLEVPKEALD